MNMKKTKLGKLLPKIALLLAIVTLFTVVLTSCGSNTAISTSDEMKKAEYWQDKEIDLNASSGFIDKLLSYIGVFLGWITKIMPANNYILTLFVFAIILEIVMLPFSIKQQKNSIKQAKMRPKEMAIRKKYAGREDNATKQKMSMEIQQMYQKEGFNPMGGCLPLLIQFPIIIALYNIVMNPLKYICR